MNKLIINRLMLHGGGMMKQIEWQWWALAIGVLFVYIGLGILINDNYSGGIRFKDCICFIVGWLLIIWAFFRGGNVE